MSCDTHEDEGEMKGQVLESLKNKPDECIAFPLSVEDLKNQVKHHNSFVECSIKQEMANKKTCASSRD